MAHVLFLLDSTGIEHERKKRDKKGNLNGVPQWGLSVSSQKTAQGPLASAA